MIQSSRLSSLYLYLRRNAVSVPYSKACASRRAEQQEAKDPSFAGFTTHNDLTENFLDNFVNVSIILADIRIHAMPFRHKGGDARE